MCYAEVTVWTVTPRMGAFATFRTASWPGRMALAFAASSVFAACYSQSLVGYQVPGESITTEDKLFIVRSPTDEHSLYAMIEQALGERGLQVSSGPESEVPADADVLVKYVDRWMWDISLYLIDLTIRLYDTDQGLLLASGRSYRTSLVRESPRVMIDETIAKILPEQR